MFHISPPISAYYTSNCLSSYKFSISVQHYHDQYKLGLSHKSLFVFKKNIVHDVISKRVVKTKICEKYKISSMLLIARIKIFENTSILSINAKWMNMIALKCIFKHQSQITKNEPCQNYSSHKKTLSHIFLQNTTSVPKLSM